MERRGFSEDGVLHIYQRTISGFNLFYSIEDFLVFFTTVSIQAKKFGICLWGMCQMIDHIHLLASARDVASLGMFVSAYTSGYVREFNKHVGRKGALFEKPYGSAVKSGGKKIRSAIAYLFNNPVEKRLCRLAEEYRWNYLAYYRSSQPFSKYADKMSRRMARAMKIVKDCHRRDVPMKYRTLEILFSKLHHAEKEYLVDYIISEYFPFDRDKAVNYYKSYREMLIAINSNTGSEYDIKEEKSCKSDIPYREIMTTVKGLGVENLHSVICMDVMEKKHLLKILCHQTSATIVQIRKFLHLSE